MKIFQGIAILAVIFTALVFTIPKPSYAAGRLSTSFLATELAFSDPHNQVRITKCAIENRDAVSTVKLELAISDRPKEEPKNDDK